MSTHEPTFSVVVNTTDRAAALKTLLNALEQQSFPAFEVVAVVGPTHDNTLEVLEEFGGRVRVLRCPKPNLSKSRNVGLLAARGDIVAFIDDDAVPSRNWLAQLAAVFADPTIAGSGGMVYLVHPNQPGVQHRFGIVSALAEQCDVRTSVLDGLIPQGLSRFWVSRMMGTNMAFRRRDLLEIGGFDEFFEWVYDDTDVALRLAQAGRIVHPVGQAPVYHIPASSRNRVAYTFLGKWWIQTKASIYFSIVNGRLAGDSTRAALLRGAHLVHGHWLWTGDLWRQGKISFGQMTHMRWQEGKSAVLGLAAGLSGRRTLIPPEEIQSMANHTEPIQPFLGEDSGLQGAIDPITGRKPVISVPDSPLRICLLSQAYPPEKYEGVGRSTNLLARGLFELGHTVHVVTHGDREKVIFFDGAYVHYQPYRLDRYARYRHLNRLYHTLNYSHAVHERIRRLRLNDDIQLVDSSLWQVDGLVTALDGSLPLAVRPVTALRQISSIQEEQDDDLRLLGDMEQVLVHRADHLIANSLATVKSLQSVYGVDPTTARYTVVPYGIEPVDDAAVRPFDPMRRGQELTVLFVGRLERRKGIVDLLKAIPQVLEKMGHVRFLIAGSDNSQADGFRQRTGMTYPAYFAQKQPRCGDRVTFLGYVSEEDLQALYQSCDLFVAPSLYESFGLIYAEAMNYAKPVVACNAGAVPEIVEHGVTGLLVDPEAPAALAEAMLTLLAAPDKLRDMGLAGRRRLLDKFTNLAMARGFEAVYRQMLARAEQATRTPARSETRLPEAMP